MPQSGSKGQGSKSLGLSGGFSAAATELTRMVDSYTGVTDSGVPEISDALSAASAQSRSQGEQQAMKALRTFLEDKMDNNGLREKAVDAWKSKHAGVDREAARMDALEQPGVREMTHREDDCAAEIEMILRSGRFHEAQRCGSVRLSGDAHAMAQFFPANVVAADAKR
jgi:hypothetical protein